MALGRIVPGLLAVALLATGCFLLDSPGGVRGAGGRFPANDDDDDGSANPYSDCVMRWDWQYDAGPPVRAHVMYVLAPVENWITGPLLFGSGDDDPVAILFYGVEYGVGTQAAYLSTSGQVLLDAPSNSLGAPFDVYVETALDWFLVDGTGGVATGGTGEGHAFFNDGEECFGGDPEYCPLGQGDVSVGVGTTSLSLGSSSSPGEGFAFAFCDDF